MRLTTARRLSRPLAGVSGAFPSKPDPYPSKAISTATSTVYFSNQAAADRRKAVRLSPQHVPASLGMVADGIDRTNTSPVVIREVGTTRRVFLREPVLSHVEEVEALAYRVRTLTKNEALSSVMIGNPEVNNREDILSSALQTRDSAVRDEQVDEELDEDAAPCWYGLDPLAYSYCKDEASVQHALHCLSNLSAAFHGDTKETKIPTISIPDGSIKDAGAALLLSSYVLTTRHSTLSLQNARRGLALDPIGLSYLLPRVSDVGATLGLILSLTSLPASSDDLLEARLATHSLESTHGISILEDMLGQLRPWNQQGFLKKPLSYYGDPESQHDFNSAYRNVGVAEAVLCVASAADNSNEPWTFEEDFIPPDSPGHEDPSLALDDMSWLEDRTSSLMDAARTFHPILQEECKSLTQVIQKLEEIGSRTSSDPAEQEGIDVAKEWAERIREASPLAAAATYRLWQEGAQPWESLNSCLTRERNVQAALILQAEDYRAWSIQETQKRQTSQGAITGEDEEQLPTWTYRRIEDVTEGDVDALFNYGNPAQAAVAKS